MKKGMSLMLAVLLLFAACAAALGERVFVDDAGLAAGEHELVVQVVIDNDQTFSCARGTPQVTLTLTEKEN